MPTILKKYWTKIKMIRNLDGPFETPKDSKPRILMFAPYSFPPVCAESITASKFIYAILKKGWTIDVIAFPGATEWYPRDQVEQWSTVGQSIHFPLLSRLQVFGLKLDSVQWILKAILLGRKLLSVNKYDMILSRATPLFGHLPALVVQRKAKIPWIANWSDPLPCDKAPPPYGHGPDTKLGIFRNTYLNLVSKYAHCHTFPSERLRQYYRLYLPHAHRKGWVVPHIALSDFQTNTIMNTEKFIIGYSGSLTFRSVDILFKALSRLSAMVGNKIFLDFIVHNHLEISDKTHQYGVASLVTVNSNKNYHATQVAMRDASVLLIIEAQCDEGIYLPSKVSDIVQTGKPILALSPREGVLNDLITQHGGGMVVDNQSVDAVMNALESLFKAWQRGYLQEKYGSRHLMTIFGEDAVVEILGDVVDCALKRTK